MLLKSSSLLQILLLLALVVSLTASPMEIDEEKGKEKEKYIPKRRHSSESSLEIERRERKDQSFANPEYAKLHDSQTVVDMMITKKITALGGIECNEKTFGLSACYAPTRYRNGNNLDISVFRENFPEKSYLRYIYKCERSKIIIDKKGTVFRVYYWNEMRCPGKMSFCSIRRDGKEGQTVTKKVQVLCMGENKPRQGSKNWFDANPSVTEVDIYGKNKKAIHYMNGYIVTNHEEVTKEIIQKFSFTIGDKPYNAFLQTLSADEKLKRGTVEPLLLHTNRSLQSLCI